MDNERSRRADERLLGMPSKTLVRVILGDKKFVNTEAPRANADLFCFKCKAPIRDLRSFKCHNWAYAKPQLLDILEQMRSKAR